MHQQLLNYIRAGYPGIYIQSYEEARVEHELRVVATQAQFELFAWSCTSGIADADGRVIADVDAAGDPIAMLDKFVTLPEKSLLLCRDFHMFLADSNPLLIRKVKDALVVGKASNRVLIPIGCQLRLPPELEKEITVVEFKLPDREQLRVVLANIAESAGLALNGNTDAILDAASGLTTREAEDAFALSVVEAKDIKSEIVSREKAATCRKNGILEIVETQETLSGVGGYGTIKDWIRKRKHAFGKEAHEYGLPVPKGLLLVGVPGCGKTQIGKAIANALNVPLLKLDCGKIFGSLVGESERNLRTAIQTAEAVAPCVLLADEVEKGLSGSKSSGSTDGGTSARVFGTFLQWMNDKTAPVFVVATANDISQLPPEFLRKGRFDELFFVDLPDEEEREEIFRIHIHKRRRDASSYSVQRLAELANEFTGAEIEAVVNEGLFSAFDDKLEPADQHFEQAIRSTVPLARTMSGSIDALRQWANGRARRASPVKAVEVKSGRKLA